MHHRLRPIAKALGAAALVAILGGMAARAESTASTRNSSRKTSSSTTEPAAWQGPALTAQLVPPIPPQSPPRAIDPSIGQPIDADQQVTPVLPPPQTVTPLLDGKLPTEELLPPVVTEGTIDEGGRQGVEPYGGGHPTDWSWGCGGSPYRTGPGLCDNWKVGCRWHVTVDGMVMSRDDTDLLALADAMDTNFNLGNLGILGNGDPDLEQFDRGPGGRITFTSQISKRARYDVQAVYEGINNWDASVVFPKQIFNNVALPIPPLTGTQTTTANGVITQTGVNTLPGGPFPQQLQQRSLHYRSTLNSGELNFLPGSNPVWRPFFGARFIRLNDEINDFLNQETQPPLAGPRTDVIAPGPVAGVNITVNDPIGPTFETDRLNIVHLDNNLMGFQIGLLKDTMRLNDRFAIEGFVSGGVYYNKVKYSNVAGVFTRQTFADNTRTTAFDESRVDDSNIVINDARDLDEISYHGEASLTGVCRLNKCWALRGGYQVLWINHVHLADEAYLGNVETDEDLFFHGWHFGLECRR